METNWGGLISKVNNLLARHPPFSATQHLLYANRRPSPASPYAQGSLFPLADPSKEPFQPHGSAPFFLFLKPSSLCFSALFHPLSLPPPPPPPPPPPLPPPPLLLPSAATTS